MWYHCIFKYSCITTPRPPLHTNNRTKRCINHLLSLETSRANVRSSRDLDPREAFIPEFIVSTSIIINDAIHHSNNFFKAIIHARANCTVHQIATKTFFLHISTEIGSIFKVNKGFVKTINAALYIITFFGRHAIAK